MANTDIGMYVSMFLRRARSERERKCGGGFGGCTVMYPYGEGRWVAKQILVFIFIYVRPCFEVGKVREGERERDTCGGGCGGCAVMYPRGEKVGDST